MKIEITKIEDLRYAATVEYPWGLTVRCIGGTIKEAVRLAASDIGQKERSQSFAVPAECRPSPH